MASRAHGEGDDSPGDPRPLRIAAQGALVELQGVGVLLALFQDSGRREQRQSLEPVAILLGARLPRGEQFGLVFQT